MADPGQIFRQEALRHHEGKPGHGDVPRVSPRWTAQAYWALLALIAAGIAASALIRVGQAARGPAAVRGQVVQAVVPAAFAPALRAGMPIKFAFSGRPPVTVAVASTGPDVPSLAAAGRLLGTHVSAAGLGTGPLLVVRAPAPQGVASGTVGDASIQVSSQPLIAALAPDLSSLGGG